MPQHRTAIGMVTFSMRSSLISTSFAEPPQSTGLFPPLGYPPLEFRHGNSMTKDPRYPETILSGSQRATQSRLNISGGFDSLIRCSGLHAKVERQTSTVQLQKASIVPMSSEVLTVSMAKLSILGV